MNKHLCNIAFALGLSSIASVALAAGEASGGDAARGEALVAVCSGCHGADGNSPAPNFPKLANLGERYLHKQLQDIKTRVRVVPEMTGILDNNTDQDLADMAAYYDSKQMQLSGAQPMNVQVNSGAQVDAIAMAQKLYRGGNPETGTPSCTGCHSPRGLGNEPALFPRLSGQHPQYIEKQLRDFRAGNRVNDGDSQVMRSVAQYLSDAEIVALANYIGGLN